MRRGIFQGAFPAGPDLAHCFELAHGAGFEGVELSLETAEPLMAEAHNEATAAILAIERSIGLHKPRAGGLRLDSSPRQIETIRRQAQTCGLNVVGVSTMQLFYYPLSSPNQRVRGQAVRIVRAMIEATASLGGDVVLIVPGMVTPDTPYQEVWRRSQETLAPLVVEAGQAGVRLAIENVWNRFLLSPLEYCRYIDEFDSPAVGAYFDVANVLRYGYPDHWIELLGTRLARVHFKDYRLDLDTIQAFCPLLQGDVPWPRVMAALHNAGYDDWIVVETSPYRGLPAQALFDAAQALNRLLALPAAVS